MAAKLQRFVFAPQARPSLPVAGTTELFPVRRIYCLGRNYAAHAVEMGHDPSREEPFFFQKPGDALRSDGIFPCPPGSPEAHFEVELVVALKSGGRDIDVSESLKHVFGYAVGLDMTRRDLQQAAKAAGRPWEIGKAFDSSAPCFPIVPAEVTGYPASGAIWLKRNGAVAQSGDLAQMIWKIPEAIAYLSRFSELAGGDLIMTGTPAGVGRTDSGDILEIGAAGLGPYTVRVV